MELYTLLVFVYNFVLGNKFFVLSASFAKDRV